jgi:hypothetical protein
MKPEKGGQPLSRPWPPSAISVDDLWAIQIQAGLACFSNDPMSLSISAIPLFMLPGDKALSLVRKRPGMQRRQLHDGPIDE